MVDPQDFGQPLPWTYNDGGRDNAGFKGTTRDCVTRAIAIATRQPYRTVYDDLNALAKKQRLRTRARSNARLGVHRKVYEPYLTELGWRYVPLAAIGQPSKLKLKVGDFTYGRVIASVRRHLCCIIDGTIHDTWNPADPYPLMVYGYYKLSTDKG